MRIESGLQGYYYNQGRFQRPDSEIEETADAQGATGARTFSPAVESSTLLSTALSDALWAIDDGRATETNGYAFPAGYADSIAEASDLAARVSALYLEDEDVTGRELLYA